MTDDQPSALELITADRAKGFDGMLAILVRQLVNDDPEMGHSLLM